MARSHKFSFLLVSLALTGLLSTACDSGVQEPDAPAGEAMGVEDSSADSAATAEATDTEFAASRYPELPEGVAAAVPDNFPTELPLYPGAEPAQGRGVEVEGVPMSALQLLTMDPPEKVFEFYTEKLQSDGWEIEDNERFRGKNALSFTNGSCKGSMLVAPTEDGGSDIFLITEC